MRFSVSIARTLGAAPALLPRLTPAGPRLRLVPPNDGGGWRRRRLRQITRRGVEGCFLLGLFAVVFEATCRLEDWIRYRTPLLSPYLDQSELVVFTPAGAQGRPNARFQKWVLNELGMRGPSAHAARTPGVARIVTAGASETFGLYESPDAEYPRQLERRLNTEVIPACGAGTHRFEVLNAALPGMSLPTVTNDITRRVAGLRPDVIVLYPTPVQYLNIDAPAPIAPGTDDASASPPLSDALRPRAAPRLREQVKQMLPDWAKTRLRQQEIAAYTNANPAGWQFTNIPAHRLAQYERDLEAAIAAIQSAGAMPVVMVHANAFAIGAGSPTLATMWQKVYPRATPQTLVGFEARARAVTLAVANRTGAATVDVTPQLAREHVHAFQDYSHFTDEGAARVAAALTPAVAGATGCGGNAGLAVR